jgi:hypothetical protein
MSIEPQIAGNAPANGPDGRTIIAIVLTLMIGMIVYFSKCSEPSRRKTPVVVERKVYTKEDAIFEAEYYLKHNYLHDPDSYEQEAAAASNIGDDKYTVSLKYRAKNRLGANSLEIANIYVDLRGQKVMLLNTQ